MNMPPLLTYGQDGGVEVVTLAERPVIRAATVAALLNCSEGAFRNKRRNLERDGFPPKLPGCNGWSRAAVMRWIDTNAGRDLPEPAPDAAPSRLAARYAS